DVVYDLYDINFYVVYHDKSKTMEAAEQMVKDKEAAKESVSGYKRRCIIEHIWDVNEEGPYRLPTDIANGEVSIAFNEPSYSEDWVTLKDELGGCLRDGWCAKKVDIHDCEKLIAVYEYKVLGGKWLTSFERKTVEKVMNPEEFKAEMLKYRLVNV
ncbi:MAG: hypothetical protein NC223_11845, partial [Butyrivibrio sp.]|nr:hypothetical protein [Butyrivibrio sp.]